MASPEELSAQLELLESGNFDPKARDSAIDTLALHVEEQTHTAYYLASGETTERIRNIIVKLLDTRDSQLPISKLLWMLGRIDDPSLADHLREWLADYDKEFKRYNAAIHNCLVILDVITGKHRSASPLDVAENIRRVSDYLDERSGW